MRLPPRRSDDADLIRDRLRALLHESHPPGWVPGGDEDAPVDLPDADGGDLPAGLGRHRAPGTAVRVAPTRRAAWSLWVAGVLAALLVAGGTWLGRPQVQPVPVPLTSPAEEPPAPAPEVGVAAGTATTVVVSVVGQVARPGLVTLPEGARVADAVDAAGGLLPDADPASVNLAAVVSDGQQVAVGLPGAAAAGPAAGGAPGGPGLLDLNAAAAADLDALPGIGPVLAQRIVEHRDRSGPFRSVEQLDDVPGIGPTTYAELAELVTV
ncbi:competence protein ComEA [Geodermatophilus pulveris]|uniref:Competence protein ComEA n=1 Tax=Geodermatophilus pulveris TaxID=1564159 RepID=A0A239IMA7_9ACTN|nr:helix-hairpin-helix domain-containing protein [Geodermatophilus pulveris]SNS94348.1 competence protein ComEA [Geodermatophilus pulveris]